MSNPQQHQVDPRLQQLAETPQRQPPPPPPPFASSARSDSLKAPSDAGPYGSPYFHYPSPQTQTPQQASGPQSIGSGQPSPNNPTYQQAPLHEAASPDHGDEHGDDAKRPRACEACRGLKVRCDQDPTHPDQPCRRCAKAGRQCIITQPSRKRQKKSDTRVAELEKKLDALTAALQQSQQAGAGQYQAPPQMEAHMQPALVPKPAYDGAVGSFSQP